jgi:hypothetical protein
MSSKPSLIKRTPLNRDNKGRAEYLVRLPLWKRYPRIFILGGGVLVGCSVWIYPVITGVFYKYKKIFQHNFSLYITTLYLFCIYSPENAPYQADWWPSEIRKGKKIVDQYRERQEKIHLWEAEYKRDMAAKAAAAAQLEKVVLK